MAWQQAAEGPECCSSKVILLTWRCRCWRCRLQDELPENLANSSSTIAWWQSRQAEVDARLRVRRAAMGRVAQTVSEIQENGKKAVNKLPKIFELVGGKANK